MPSGRRLAAALLALAVVAALQVKPHSASRRTLRRLVYDFEARVEPVEAPTHTARERVLSLDDAATLGGRGWVQIKNWVPAADVEALRGDAAKLRQQGCFVKSKIGSRSVDDTNGNMRTSLTLDEFTRCSETAWLRPPQPPHLGTVDARHKLDDRIEALYADLEEMTGSKLLPFKTELSYAFYPEGGHYARHVDVPRTLYYNAGRNKSASPDAERRMYSVLVYLNEGWRPEDGGALRVFEKGPGNALRLHDTDAGDSHVDVLPEVMESFKDRWAVVAWFRANRRDCEKPHPLLDSTAFQAAQRFEARGFDRAALEALNRVVAETDTERAYVEIRKAHICFDGLDDLEGAARHWNNALAIEDSVVALNGLGLVEADASLRRGWHDRALAYAPRDARSAVLALAADADASADGVVECDLYRRLDAASPHLTAALNFILGSGGAHLRRGTRAMLAVAVDAARGRAGDVLECGVYHGRSLRMFRELTDRPMHGFDSFEGLPEAWGHEPAASYSYARDTGGAQLPSVDGAQMHAGWFSDTLPPFLAKQAPGYAPAIVHLDCDLYSSTMDVLAALGKAARDGTAGGLEGTVLVFDDYLGGHETWMQDQHKALLDAANDFGWRYEYIALSLVTKQAVVRIL